ncbi:MAG: hypothetical protein ACPGQL_10240 [Thermoplasmatota archaeon]
MRDEDLEAFTGFREPVSTLRPGYVDAGACVPGFVLVLPLCPAWDNAFLDPDGNRTGAIGRSVLLPDGETLFVVRDVQCLPICYFQRDPAGVLERWDASTGILEASVPLAPFLDGGLVQEMYVNAAADIVYLRVYRGVDPAPAGGQIRGLIAIDAATMTVLGELDAAEGYPQTLHQLPDGDLILSSRIAGTHLNFPASLLRVDATLTDVRWRIDSTGYNDPWCCGGNVYLFDGLVIQYLQGRLVVRDQDDGSVLRTVGPLGSAWGRHDFTRGHDGRFYYTVSGSHGPMLFATIDSSLSTVLTQRFTDVTGVKGNTVNTDLGHMVVWTSDHIAALDLERRGEVVWERRVGGEDLDGAGTIDVTYDPETGGYLWTLFTDASGSPRVELLQPWTGIPLAGSSATLARADAELWRAFGDIQVDVDLRRLIIAGAAYELSEEGDLIPEARIVTFHLGPAPLVRT